MAVTETGFIDFFFFAPAFVNSAQVKIRIGYRLRWRSDIWRTDRGAAEVRSPDIRPTTEDIIRHNTTKP